MTLQRMTDEERRAWEITLQKVDSIFSDTDVTVTDTRGGPAPAFTDLKHDKIHLDFDQMEEILRDVTHTESERARNIRAFNYHELAHQLFSKANFEKVPSDLHRMFNALEDGRIETLLGKQYPKISTLFIFLTTNAIATNPSPENFVLLWGRRAFLPPDAMSIHNHKTLMEEKYGNAVTREIEREIDRFMATDFEGQKDAVRNVMRLLRGNHPTAEPAPDETHGTPGDRSKTGTGEPRKSDRKEMKEHLKKSDDEMATEKRIREAVKRVKQKMGGTG